MRDPLTVQQVMFYWLEAIQGVTKNGSGRSNDGDMVFDAKATRTVCKKVVQSTTGYSVAIERTLPDFILKGVEHEKEMLLCVEFKEELIKVLNESPVYPCFKPEREVAEPREMLLTELQKELGFKHHWECKRFLLDQQGVVIGLAHCNKRWYLQRGVFEILQENAKSREQSAA